MKSLGVNRLIITNMYISVIRIAHTLKLKQFAFPERAVPSNNHTFSSSLSHGSGFITSGTSHSLHKLLGVTHPSSEEIEIFMKMYCF